MTKQGEIIPMDGKLHPIGTLMYEDNNEPDHSTSWKPHRNIWRVVAHRECRDFPNAPVKLACEIVLAWRQDL